MKLYIKIILMLGILYFLCHFIRIENSSLTSLMIYNKNSLLSIDQTIYDHLIVHNNADESEVLNIQKKKIYIYNTHQNEKYQTNDVMDGAEYLKELLVKKGYEVILEETNFDQYKKDHQMDLTENYPTSKIFLLKNINEFGPFDLIIDYHRDALSRDKCYITINGKSYAKVMFVVGGASKNKDNVTYNSNILKDTIDLVQPGIMRSVFSRAGSTYNQDVADKSLLVEVGGQHSTFVEVKNSLDVLASAIDLCLKEGKLI